MVLEKIIHEYFCETCLTKYNNLNSAEKCESNLVTNSIPVPAVFEYFPIEKNTASDEGRGYILITDKRIDQSHRCILSGAYIIPDAHVDIDVGVPCNVLIEEWCRIEKHNFSVDENGGLNIEEQRGHQTNPLSNAESNKILPILLELYNGKLRSNVIPLNKRINIEPLVEIRDKYLSRVKRIEDEIGNMFRSVQQKVKSWNSTHRYCDDHNFCIPGYWGELFMIKNKIKKEQDLSDRIKQVVFPMLNDVREEDKFQFCFRFSPTEVMTVYAYGNEEIKDVLATICRFESKHHNLMIPLEIYRHSETILDPYESRDYNIDYTEEDIPLIAEVLQKEDCRIFPKSKLFNSYNRHSLSVLESDLTELYQLITEKEPAILIGNKDRGILMGMKDFLAYDLKNTF